MKGVAVANGTKPQSDATPLLWMNKTPAFALFKIFNTCTFPFYKHQALLCPNSWDFQDISRWEHGTTRTALHERRHFLARCPSPSSRYPFTRYPRRGVCWQAPLSLSHASRHPPPLVLLNFSSILMLFSITTCRLSSCYSHGRKNELYFGRLPKRAALPSTLASRAGAPFPKLYRYTCACRQHAARRTHIAPLFVWDKTTWRRAARACTRSNTLLLPGRMACYRRQQRKEGLTTKLPPTTCEHQHSNGQ